MTWWSAADELLLVAFWLLVPGAVVGRAVGLRGIWVLFAAPAVSVGVLVAWPVVYGLIGVPWNPWTAALAVVLTAGTLALVQQPLAVRGTPRHARRPRERSVWRDTGWQTLAAVAVGGVLSVAAIGGGMGRPDLFPQAWDAVFHLNATRYIVETGQASSLTLGVVNDHLASSSFYPGAWHALAALGTTDSVLVASNAVALLVAGLVWPLGLAALSRAVVPQWPWLGVSAPVLGAAFVAFPANLLSWGTVWPNALAYALVPSVVALTVQAFRPHRGTPARLRLVAERLPFGLAAAAGIGAIGLAQPNGVLIYAVVATPAVLAWWAGAVPRSTARGRVALVGLMVAWLAVWSAIYALFANRITINEWRGETPFWEGVLAASGDGRLGEGFSPLLATLVGLGVVTVLFVRNGRWLVLAFAALLALYGFSVDEVGMNWWVRPWYSDANRLAGAVPLVGALLAAAGVSGVAHAIAAGVGRMRRGPSIRARRVKRTRRGAPDGVLSATLTVAILALVVLGSGMLRADLRENRVAAFYTRELYAQDTDKLVAADELRMLARLEHELPPGARLLGDPFTGAPLAYAVSGIDVVFPHMRGRWTTDERYVAQHLGELASDPVVCQALRRMDVQYYYADTDNYFPSNRYHKDYKGLPRTVPEQGFEEIDRGGTAAVYRITACDAA